MATYQFDVEHAERFGVNEAIFLGNLIFWLRKNKAEGRNFHEDEDGVLRVWTFSTLEALGRLYPFWSIDQIRHVIKKLKAQDVIRTAHFSKNRFDRTLWFALSDESMMALRDVPMIPEKEGGPAFGKFPKSKRQKSLMEVTEIPDPSDENPTSLKGTDNRNRYTETDSSLNVSGEGESVQHPSEKPEALTGQRPTNEEETDIYRAEVVEPVEEAISLTGDAKSRRRWVQLREICVESNATAAWIEAIGKTRQRIAKGGVAAPGAYLQVALLRELDKRGIVPPTGSEEEREDVQGAIGASLGLMLDGE